jgi:hypothetical protein
MTEGLRALIYPDAPSFLGAVGEGLMQAEELNGLPAGILLSLVDQPDRYGGQPFLCAVSGQNGRLVAAAVQTPLRNLVLCAGFDWTPEAMDSVIDCSLSEGLVLPGVIGPAELASAFASRHSYRFRTGTKIAMELGHYVLTKVEGPAFPASGFMRKAVGEDLPLVHSWIERFYLDCFGEVPSYASCPATERMVESGDIFIWMDPGPGPVSMAGKSRPTWHGTTISMVYTPPEFRGNGYATNCVARLSSLLLQSGCSFCTLFTDLANPTSNSIYARIGYKRTGTYREIRFES